ncbi:MAG: diguanylate cyclase [Minicystis sp.]
MDPPSFATLEPDTLFHGRYRVVRRIKAGTMGAVYEVVDEVTNRRRALKVMLASAIQSPGLRARFAQEATITGGIESDHVVRVSDAGIDGGSGMPFLVMDLLHGEELGSLAARRGPLPPAEVVLYLSQVALALDKTHAARIVHRDLKPENLFVTARDDGTPCVKILDFGVAKIIAPAAAAQRTAMVGTPLYMAPEQVRGDRAIGPEADIHALGHVAYTLLVGAAYWLTEAQTSFSLFALFNKMLAGLPEAPTLRAARTKINLPPAFDAWFRRATAADRKDRFARATIAIAELAEALGVGHAEATVAALVAAPPPSVPRRAPSVAPPASRRRAEAPEPAPKAAATPAVDDEITRLFVDALTKVYNERYLQVALEREFARAKEGDGKLAVLLFGIHDLRAIEKTQGRRAADAAIQELARAVQIYVPASGILARCGAHALALVLPGTGPTGASAREKVLGERVQKRLAGRGGAKAARFSICVAAAHLERADASGADLLARAARALRDEAG